MEFSMKEKVIVFTTGGTIAMRHDPVSGGAVPAVSGPELVEAVPSLAEVCPVEVREFANIPSPHMTPRLMFDLARKVEEALAEPDVSGAVITHGTDTLEESAYFMDLYVDGDKPVCLTAAMRGAAEIGADGPKNILCAVRAAASPLARGKGALVVLNEEIHAAREVTKTHSANPKAFASPFWGPLGYVDTDRVIFRRVPFAPRKIHPAEIDDDVFLIKLFAGADDSLFDFLVEKKVSGIVVEGFGRGNVPPGAFKGMKRAVGSGIPVVITTRCPGGRVLDVYAYEGGVKGQLEAGVILGGELNGQKARIKLILALGMTRDHETLAEYFDEP
ncbi:MAG: asparaginase [Candidatus Accumulibacter sp.]|jgi:L-asparaginase|nr:asparaginase [Accumulibacter sp.]